MLRKDVQTSINALNLNSFQQFLDFFVHKTTLKLFPLSTIVEGEKFLIELNPTLKGRVHFLGPAMGVLLEGSAIGTQTDGQLFLSWTKFVIADLPSA